MRTSDLERVKSLPLFADVAADTFRVATAGAHLQRFPAGTVLLLEGDFHWPSVHRLMRVEMPLSTGFSQQLRAHSHGQPADRFSVVECSRSLHVLGEGVMRSPGLILTKQFEDSIRALRTYYDFIVIDGPATEAEVDCRALASAIDGAVLVGYHEDSPEFMRAARLFPNRRFVLGVV